MKLFLFSFSLNLLCLYVCFFSFRFYGRLRDLRSSWKNFLKLVVTTALFSLSCSYCPSFSKGCIDSLFHGADVDSLTSLKQYFFEDEGFLAGKLYRSIMLFLLMLVALFLLRWVYHDKKD